MRDNEIMKKKFMEAGEKRKMDKICKNCTNSVCVFRAQNVAANNCIAPENFRSSKKTVMNKETENTRKQFWIDVYLAYVGAENSIDTDGGAKWADIALERFDERFPSSDKPVPDNGPYHDIL